MAITRQVITSLQRDGTDALGTRTVAMKIVDESIVSGSLLTVESNHFCILKSRGAVLNVGVDQSSDARCLDVSQVSGISFWAHVGQASMPLEVVFIIPETQYAASTGKGFGDCLDRCNDHPRATVLLTAEWTRFFVPFQGTDQGNARVGKLLQAVGWEPTSAPGQPFFLDEIAFYK